MGSNENEKKMSKKRLSIIIGIIAVIACAGICLAIWRPFDNKTEQKENNTPTATNDNKQTSKPQTDEPVISGAAADNSPASQNGATLSIEDAPEPTLNPGAENVTVQSSDPEPEVILKQYQKSFNDDMAAGDYEGAKAVLDEYFSTSEYAIAGVSGGNTYDNYVYYYEKQKQYEESAKFQIDFMEKNFGLNNITETSTRYQRLMETLQYVNIDDPRLEQIQASVNRWKNAQNLLDNNEADTCVTQLREMIANGLECAYAYIYLGLAYHQQKDYLSEAKTYYIGLLKLRDRDCNLLESQLDRVINDRMVGLYDLELITDEEKDFIQNEITIDTKP